MRARRVLKIDPEGEQQLSFATFGSAKGSPKVWCIVSVGILLKGYFSMTVSQFVVPMICEALIAHLIDMCINQNRHLTGLAKLQLSCLWRYGPDWLNGSLTLNDADGPMHWNARRVFQGATTQFDRHWNQAHNSIQCEGFSSFRRLVRVTAYVMRCSRAREPVRAAIYWRTVWCWMQMDQRLLKKYRV